MPGFLAPLLTPILTGAASKITRIVVYGLIAIFIGFLLYSAFLKKTQSYKTTQTADKITNYWSGAQIHIGMMSCVSLQAEKYLKELK